MHATLQRPIAVLLTLAVGLGVVPSAVASKKPARGAELRGVVHDADGKALGGVRVVLTPMEGGAPVQTATTSANGGYSFRELAQGPFQISFEHNGQAFIGNRALLLAPRTKTTANFRLGPFEPQDSLAGLKSGQKAPGLDAVASGVGRIEEQFGPSGMAWLRTGKGVAILIGAGALLVGGLIVLSDRGKQASVSPSSQ